MHKVGSPTSTQPTSKTAAIRAIAESTPHPRGGVSPTKPIRSYSRPSARHGQAAPDTPPPQAGHRLKTPGFGSAPVHAGSRAATWAIQAGRPSWSWQSYRQWRGWSFGDGSGCRQLVRFSFGLRDCRDKQRTRLRNSNKTNRQGAKSAKARYKYSLVFLALLASWRLC